MRIPKQVEGIIFRKKNGSLEFLLLKRIKSRGGFWQFVTGGVEEFDKSLLKCLMRELNEELKIKSSNVKKLIKNVGSFDFEVVSNSKKNLIKEYIFGVELDTNFKIKINYKEHEKFEWVDKKGALKFLKFEDNKKALKSLIKKIDSP